MALPHWTTHKSRFTPCGLYLTSAAGPPIKTPARGWLRGSEIDNKINIGMLIALAFVLGQTPVAATSQNSFEQPVASATAGKQWKFAVVSIRKNNSDGPTHIGVATADGYQMKNLFLGYLLLSAYGPQRGAAFYSVGQIIGMPAWMESNDDRYDVDAKVDDADLADWQNPAKQPAMLRSMLQALLEDRLKLVVHRTFREAPVDLLLVGKNGPKFKQTNPGEPHPGSR